jgi:Fic family protein
MDNERMGRSPIGQLVPIEGEDAGHGKFACSAYLPAELPQDFTNLNSNTWAEIVRASESLARLDQCSKSLPDPGLLIYPSLIREAMASSALEGTHGILTEVLESRFISQDEQSAETMEIAAFIDAATSSFQQIRHRQLSIGLLCEIQKEMFKNSKKPPRDVGAIRTHQVSIGDESLPIEQRRFVPPPGDDRLKAGMDSLIQWINSPSDLTPVLRAALAHYQFESLHPFGDGNGRVGRLVIILQLMSYGTIGDATVTLSPWFYRNRARYQDELLSLSETGDWDAWILFVCQAIIDQCGRLITSADSLLLWVEETKDTLSSRNWSGIINKVVMNLVEWPKITVPWIAKTYEIKYASAKYIVAHLVEVGAIEEITGRTYGKIYAAPRVMAIVEET